MTSQCYLPIVAATMILAATGYGQDSLNIQEAINAVRAGADAASPIDVVHSKELQKLKGHWVVRSVERDGIRNPAQVGQEVGDIISFEHVNDQFQLG